MYLPSINPPRKLMEEYWFLAPACLGFVEYFFLKLPRQSYHCKGQATRSIDEENCFVWEGDRVTRLELLADWPEKYFSGQSAGRNLTISGTGSVRVSSQEVSKLSPENIARPKNIASSWLVAPGFPRMTTAQPLMNTVLSFSQHSRSQ